MNDPAVGLANYSDVLAAPADKTAEVIHGVLPLVDPDALTLETYQLGACKWVEMGAYSGGDRPRAVPFDAIELELATLWADVEPPPEQG